MGRPGVLSDICRLGLAGRSQHLSEALEFSTREDTLLTQALVLPSDSASPLLTLTVTQELWWQVSWKPDHTNTCPSPYPIAEQVGNGGGRNGSGGQGWLEEGGIYLLKNTQSPQTSPVSSSLTPEPPSYSQSARRKRREGGECARCHPASADGWAGAAPRRCSAAPPR